MKGYPPHWGRVCYASQELSLFTFEEEAVWCPILDPVTHTIGNNLKGDWGKGQIQDIIRSSVVRKFSRKNFVKVLRR